MGVRKIGFGTVREEDTTPHVEDRPTFVTIIQCDLCEEKLYYHELIATDDIDASCECGAIMCGNLPATGAKFKNFLAVRSHGRYPKIYDVPYEEYLKTK
tara:strand:+ start:4947 stop:5243 length:297 start_codon:yes stop_codon:yes gene_type:complete